MVIDVVMEQLDRVHERIAGRFTRSEPRARAREYVSGLVAGLERKNGWTLAEQAGEVSPDGMQRLLRWADWDIDGVRDDVRGYVIEHLGEPGGVLIVDDTGFLKKGTRSAGVQRQYSGTAGRIENCQIGTFLAYASPRGHALIDRELYLPEPWIADPDRCRRAGIPDGTEFETKPRQAMAMLARAFAAKVPFAWITADEAYGQVKYLRLWLEAHDAAHVLATKVNDTLVTTGGREARADELIADLPARSWRRLSVGAGAHGPREYEWARIPDPDRLAARARALAARPPLTLGSDRDCLLRLLRTPPRHSAGPGLDRRGSVADRGVFPAGQERGRVGSVSGPVVAGLVCPHHPVDARPRLARRLPIPCHKRGTGAAEPGMIGFTLPEIRRLLTKLVLRVTDAADHVWSWSSFRRRRQHQARLSHYKRRGYPLT